jgi:PAS domain S-box-containing protein
MKVDHVIMSGEIISRLQDILLLVDIDGRVLDANPAALACYGYPASEIASLHLRDLEAPQSQSDVRAHLMEAADRGGVYCSRHRRADGTAFPVEMISVPVLLEGVPALLAIVRDISERQQAAEELRQSQEQLQAIIDNTPLLVFVKDLDGRFTLVNRKFEDLLGSPGETLVGKMGEEFQAFGQAEAHRLNDLVVAEQRAPTTFEEMNEAPDGAHFYLSTKFPLFGADGEVTAVCGISTDITELKDSAMKLAVSNARLETMVKDITQVMGRVVETRDPYTQGHEVRVAQLAMLLAGEMGLSEDAIAGVEMASMVHDIGKLAVPAEILSKPGALTEQEYALVQCHSAAGYEILKGIDFPWPVAISVLQHHERMDGSGYPKALRGQEICLTARILAVADVVEAMSSHRPYRAALGLEAAVAEIFEHPEKYDPSVTTACRRLYESGRIVWEQFA